MQQVKLAAAGLMLRLARPLLIIAGIIIVYRSLPGVVQAAVVAITPFVIAWSLWHHYRLYDPEHDEGGPLPSWQVLLVGALLMLWSLRTIYLGLLVSVRQYPAATGVYLVAVVSVACYTAWLWVEETPSVQAAIRTWRQRKLGSWMIWGQTADHSGVIAQSSPA